MHIGKLERILKQNTIGCKKLTIEKRPGNTHDKVKNNKSIKKLKYIID